MSEVATANRRFVRPTNGGQLTATGLAKSYRKGNHSVPVLAGVDLSVR